MRRWLPLLFAVLLAMPGCLSVDWESDKIGTPRPVLDAHRLEPGRSTLRDTLALLGPPDLILRVGEVDRAYYVCWDSDYIKVVLSAPLPLAGRRSLDAFILGFGSEELRMARLEFDRAGILRELQRLDTLVSRDGEYVAIDNRIVENFLEDRARALKIVENDDDDADLHPQRPPVKKP